MAHSAPSDDLWTEATTILSRLAMSILKEDRSATDGHIQDMAYIFGWDIVLRRAPQQAHEHMIALRRAEDGDVTGQVLR